MKYYIILALIVLGMTACTDNDSTATGSQEGQDSAVQSPSDGSQRGTTTGTPRGAQESITTDGRTSPSRHSESGDSDIPTAGDQTANSTDMKITQSVRKAVMEDDTLSLMAKNAIIVTVDGVVILRGSVRDATEVRSIGNKAERVTGVRSVHNLLEFTPK